MTIHLCKQASEEPTESHSITTVADHDSLSILMNVDGVTSFKLGDSEVLYVEPLLPDPTSGSPDCETNFLGLQKL